MRRQTVVVIITATLCLTLLAWQARAELNQGLDETTGIIHNGQWQNGVTLGAMG